MPRPPIICSDSSAGMRASLLGVVLAFHLLLLGCASLPVDGQLQFVFLPLMGGNSPSMDLMGVAAALHARGHAVMVVVSDSGLAFAKQAAARHASNTTAESMTYVTFNMPRTIVPEDVGNVIKQGQSPGKFSSMMMLTAIQRMLAIPCAALLQDKTAMQRLHGFSADAVMGIPLPMPLFDSCGCVMSQTLGVPFIDINGHPMIDAPVTVPQFGAGITEEDVKTVGGFAKNLIAYTARNLMPTLAMDFGPNPWLEIRKAEGLPRTASNCLLTNALARLRGEKVLVVCKPLLEVMLASFLVEYPRPLAPHKKLVGPGTPRPPHAIQPQGVADFVEGAGADGLVLVAFGSTVQSITLTSKDLEELAKGFAALAPTRVLWAMSGLPDGLQLADLNLAPNTKVVSWVDYNDVLGHPHTRVFVSHCGVHSIYEAAFHGVPVIAVPFQFEQAAAAARLVDRGVGVISHEAPAFRKGAGHPVHYTAQSISGLIQEMMSNASYSQAARGIAVALQAYAAQRHPYARAADEIELAVHTARASAAAAAAATAGRGVQHQTRKEEL